MGIPQHPIRLKDNAVWVHGPSGPVVIQYRQGFLEAHYAGRHLIGRNAQKYAQTLRDEVLSRLSNYQPAWTVDPSGATRITNHRQYYNDTFNPEAEALEALHRWRTANFCR